MLSSVPCDSLKKHYQKLALQYHPDKAALKKVDAATLTAQFKELTEEYELAKTRCRNNPPRVAHTVATKAAASVPKSTAAASVPTYQESFLFRPFTGTFSEKQTYSRSGKTRPTRSARPKPPPKPEPEVRSWFTPRENPGHTFRPQRDRRSGQYGLFSSDRAGTTAHDPGMFRQFGGLSGAGRAAPRKTGQYGLFGANRADLF